MFESIRNLFSPKKEEPVRKHYDPETQKPAIRCSICTGEQVAGFRNKRTGQFREVTLIRTPKDLEGFKKNFGVEDLKKIF